MTTTQDVEPAREDPPWLRPDREIRVSSWEPVDLSRVVAGEQVTPPPAAFERVDGVRLLYPGCLNAFIGEPESGKSWVAHEVCAQELKAGHHVVYLDYEDGPETAVERLRALGVSGAEIVEHFTYINPTGRFNELAEAVLQQAIDQRGAPALCIIDGVTEAMADVGLDPMSGTDVAAYYASSPRWLARTGAAVVLVDHVTKSTEGRGRWAIGSERKISGLDGAAYMFETITPFGRGREGVVKISVAKDRRGHIRQHAGAGNVIAMATLKSWPDDGVTVSFDVPEKNVGAGLRPTRIMTRISEAVVETPGLSIRALRGAVPVKHDTFDLALELLVKEGYVEVRSGPRNARLHHSVQPFGAPAPDDEVRGVEEDDIEPF